LEGASPALAGPKLRSGKLNFPCDTSFLNAVFEFGGNMSLANLANIGEFIGGIAVIFSLIYLAFQIRQNTKTVRAATELDTGRQWSEFHARVAHSIDMADIWEKALGNPEDLTVTEKRRFFWLLAEYFSLVESLFRQRQLGFLGQDSWILQRNTVAGLLLHPIVESWWNSGASPYSPEFKNSINMARADIGGGVRIHTSLEDI